MSEDQTLCINGCDARRMINVEATDLLRSREKVILVVTENMAHTSCVDVLWGQEKID